MVRRSHVVAGSIACCPWWTLGGGALVAAAAVTLSGAPTRHTAGPALRDGAARGLEVFAGERDDEDTPAGDAESAATPRPLGTPPEEPPTVHSGPVAPSAPFRVPAASFQENFSVQESARDTSLLTGPAQVPAAH